MNKGKKLTFYLVMILVLEIRMEKMRSRRRLLFLLSFPPFFFPKPLFLEEAGPLKPQKCLFRNVCDHKQLGRSLQLKETSWNTFFKQHCQSLLWLPPTLGREGTHWANDIQPLSLLTHSSSASCRRSRWKNAPFSSAVQCPIGFSHLAPAEVPPTSVAQT